MVPDRFFRCGSKEKYYSALVATKRAYHLSEVREKEFQPYICPYCKAYHIGRINRNRRPENPKERPFGY